jgi:hypothetical protein
MNPLDKRMTEVVEVLPLPLPLPVDWADAFVGSKASANNTVSAVASRARIVRQDEAEK